MYCFCGAGSYLTSVFLVLMVRRKFVQASAKLFMLCYIWLSVAASSAHSSAKKRSRTASSFTFVLDECCVQVSVLFLTFLQQLSCRE